MTKKLLFITPLFPKNLEEDNVVPFIKLFTLNFAESKNIEIDIITLMYPFSKTPYNIGKIRVYPIGGNFKKSFKKAPLFYKSILKGVQLCRKNKYDGILCFWYRESAFIGKILSSIFKIRILVWLQGQDAKISNKYVSFLRILDENLIMLSNYQRNIFNTSFKKNIQKVTNIAIDRSVFPELNKKYREIDIIGVGNLGALKNYSLFIDIVFELKISELKAIICGEGEEFEFLKNKIQLLGLNENIKLMGKVSNRKILEYMNNSKIFLHTSSFEGGSSVIHEALYSGCQVLSTIPVEDNKIENFYFSKNKQNLIEKIKNILSSPTITDRVEYFKIEDTVNNIHKHFYKF